MTELEDKLQTISDLLEGHRWDDDQREQIKDDLTTLQRRARRFRSDEEYISYIEANLGRALAIREGSAQPQESPTTDVTDWDSIDSVDAVDWRRVPLCGCASPTCAIKRGEVPSGCLDRSGGLLDPRAPTARVREFIQGHDRPHALRVIHRTWVEGYGELLADAQELLAKTRRERPTIGGRRRRQEG